MMNENGEMVSRKYKIKVFNTINFKKSMHYNPFAYIRCESDRSQRSKKSQSVKMKNSFKNEEKKND